MGGITSNPLSAIAATPDASVGMYAYVAFSTAAKTGVTQGGTLGGANTSTPLASHLEGTFPIPTGNALAGTWKWLGDTVPPNISTVIGLALRIA